MKKSTGKQQSAEAQGTETGPMFFRQNTDGSMTGYLGLATGSVVRRDDFSTTVWETDSSGWGEPIPSDAKEKIKKARSYYTKDPIVNKSVSLLAQLSNDTFTIRSENQSTEDFFQSWWKDIGGTEFLTWFFKEYFRSGNVPIFKTLIPYRPKGQGNQLSTSVANISASAESEYFSAFDNYVKGMAMYKRGDLSHQKLAVLRKAMAEKKNMWSKRMIPGAYTILDPLGVDMKGPEGLPWLRQMTLRIDQDVAAAIKNPPAELKAVVDAIPKEIVSQVRQGVDQIILPDYLASFVARDKQPYEKWAEPLTTHAFAALDFKYELRQMDIATVRGVRNRILKVTIGNDQFPALDPAALRQLATEFNNPSRTLTLFWNHTLNIEYIEPNLESLKMEKYEPVNEDIRSCFGIAKILTGNEGSSIGNNVLNLKGLIEILSEAQDAFLGWFYNEAKLIVEAVGLPEVPEGAFSKINLKDENEFMKVLMQLVDRQIISYETAVETLGYHFPREVKRLKSEQKLREKDNILIAQKAPTQGGGPSGQEGRPSDTKPKEGARPVRVGKPRSPNGTKTVSSQLNNVAEMRGKVIECFESVETEQLRVSGKKKKDIATDGDFYLNVWSNVIKLLGDEYNFAEKGSDILVTSLVKAKEVQQKSKKSFNDVLATVLAVEILQIRREEDED